MLFRRIGLGALLFLGLAGTSTGASAADDAATRQETLARLRQVDVVALQRAVADLTKTFGDQYADGPRYLGRLDKHGDVASLVKRVEAGDKKAIEQAERLIALSREALLANPLLDFDRLLVVKRSEKHLGLPKNWESNSSLPMQGYDNEIATLPIRSGGKITTLYRPEDGRFVGDVDLEFDGERMLFSMPGGNGRWQVFELGVDGDGLVQLPLVEEPDVDNYDACYLPDGNVLFTSTAPFVGVPCVTGSSHVSNVYRLDRGTGAIRRLTFEQDHDWCPTVLGDGRVLYLRWEYSDLPHFASRILFHMNPDGTGQMAHYGSNSYWPNALFYARPIPNRPTRFVGIVGGHHDVPRMGELVLFDTAKGRHEADGVVQRIPGYGKKVEPILLDGLVGASWPKFLHPYPLSDKYFLVSAKPTLKSLWGVYLVDVFDNMTLIAEEKGYALLEPVPLRRTDRPPVIPSTVKPNRRDAVVYLADVYSGPGLEGVPRGAVKRLRLYTYHFAYHGMGGQVNRVGLDGPWDIKRIMGTVPVEADGSALFRVPANTPISVQPLDAEGKALQLMRSWMTAMPGETLSCVGCHEPQNEVTAARGSTAALRKPSEITPWYGPMRGFSFKREVQPVLDAYCVACHDEEGDAPDLRALPAIHPTAVGDSYNNGTQFTPSYMALRGFVRAPTIESDMHLLPPGEFHADTTKLVRILEKGHHAVRLDTEAWDRLVTWIDLGAPAHGTWHEIVGGEKTYHQRDRRREMLRRYAGRDEDPEAVGEAAVLEAVRETLAARPEAVVADRPTEAGMPATGVERLVDLGEGVTMELILVPAGEFLMGDPAGLPDERPGTRTVVERPFWMGKFEVTNRQFARFDPSHDSRLEHGDFLHFSIQERGYPLNEPRQPVARISWERAAEFCRWLSAQTDEQFDLPSEAQWEHACRAGSSTPLWYGGTGDDFSPYANLADASLRQVDTFAPWALPSGAIPEWRPATHDVNDAHRVSAPVGSFAPNPWGLHDMHGNVAEWTSSAYARNAASGGVGASRTMVVRGGSWYERPQCARSAYRLDYEPWRRVFNVGFRVVATTGR